MVGRVIGVDIDPIVMSNTDLDAAHVTDGVTQPFMNDFFDLAYADFVLEHVEHPSAFLSEIHRVLKPRAPFFFRTPNLWHYVALISASTPHWVHRLVANPARGMTKDAHEPWPTFYRLNSKRVVKRTAREAGFSRCELRLVEAEPSYLMFNNLAFLVGVAYERLVNGHNALSGFRANIFGKLVK